MSHPDNDQKKNKSSADGSDRSVNSDPKQGKSDPQITELDGLKKGGTAPTVNPADRPRGERGQPD